MDDADIAEPRPLLHLLNAAAEAGLPVLMTARLPPARQPIKLADLAVDPMYAGTSQRFLIPLSISERDDWDSADMVWEVIDGGRFKKNKPPSRKKLGHSMMISVYKRDEGVRVYEFTAYIS